MEDEILCQIEEGRQEMHRLACLYGMTAPQVLEQSQRLDNLLNVYETMKGRLSA